MKTKVKNFDEFITEQAGIDESQLEDAMKASGRMKKELMTHVDGIKNRMRRDEWDMVIKDTEKFLEILKMVS